MMVKVATIIVVTKSIGLLQTYPLNYDRTKAKTPARTLGFPNKQWESGAEAIGT